MRRRKATLKEIQNIIPTKYYKAIKELLKLFLINSIDYQCYFEINK